MTGDGSGSHTASKTWISDEAKEREAFSRFRANLLHIAPHSPFVPRTWIEWLKQRLWLKEETHRRELHRLKIWEVERAQPRQPVHQALAGQEFEDTRSSVLAMESIWLPSLRFQIRRPTAPWPTIDELKYEGMYRNISGFCRFHPLPRVPGNKTAHWRNRPPLRAFPFDQVGSPIRRWGEPPVTVDGKMMLLIGGSLLEELDK